MQFALVQLPNVKLSNYHFFVFPQYAICFPQCQSSNVFEAASELALSSFNRELAENKDHGSRDSSDNMSPLSEACNALQKLLCSSPSHFSAPTAMSALESE